MINIENKYKISVLVCFCLLLIPDCLFGQDTLATVVDNVYAKGVIADKHTIKLRWAPANPEAWLDGKKYGYTVEKYTVIIDTIWQDMPDKQMTNVSVKPLADWNETINKSDYAAVIAQAFYGEDFELNPVSGDISGIINQANELEQRFSTSVFMAEYDYKAAELAGWAWTDSLARPNEKYLYRIYLNRPEKHDGDTAIVFIGYDDKEDLPQPVGLNAIFGDKAVLLSWNYALLSNTYHSYHVERMSPEESDFRRITALPVTVLNADMREILYTDSLAKNDNEYAYRIIGLTSFDEEGPVSDTIKGHGQKTVTCVPHIFSGDFISKDNARISWEFECSDIDLVAHMQVWQSNSIDGDYAIAVDNIPVQQRELFFNLYNETNYVKIYAINKDSTSQESFPFLLRQIDSIPPAVPTGLKVIVDTLCVAHLSWDANQEPDLRGYRILRSFTEKEEKSSVTPDFITQNEYTDTLSLALLNSKVYYSITALDVRYNESQPCEEVIAIKPNNATPDEPVFTDYEVSGNKVTLSWITDLNNEEIQYELLRQPAGMPEQSKTIFFGDYKANKYTDELSESGTYQYRVMATGANGKQSVSPQVLEFDITVHQELNTIAGFDSYIDRNNNYIELFWRKHDKAQIYRIYKAEDENPMKLWREVDASKNRIVDEVVSPDTKYKYTILFISTEGGASKSKTIVVNY